MARRRERVPEFGGVRHRRSSRGMRHGRGFLVRAYRREASMGRFHWLDMGTRLPQAGPSRWSTRWIRWWVAILGIAWCVLASSTPASAKGAISDGEVRSVVARINASGRVSPADRAALLTRPDVASQIVDPASGMPKEGLGAASPDGPLRLAAATYATRSSSADRYIQYSSIRTRNLRSGIHQQRGVCQPSWTLCLHGDDAGHLGTVRHEVWLRCFGQPIHPVQGVFRRDLSHRAEAMI